MDIFIILLILMDSAKILAVHVQQINIHYIFIFIQYHRKVMEIQNEQEGVIIDGFNCEDLTIEIEDNQSIVAKSKYIEFKKENLIVDVNGIKNTNNVSIHKNFHIDPANLKIFEVIGKGASSRVSRAVYKKNGKELEVAVKTIFAHTKDLQLQILNDLKTFLSDCNCPNLVTFFGCYYQAGSINHIIEYMDLGSLRSVIKLVYKKHVIIPQEVLSNIARSILNGLQYIHFEKNKLHRDIKPENIIFNSKGEVKITDFGLSRDITNTHGMSSTFIGTVIYMSPERMSYPNIYNHLTDIWSFGLVMFQLATGDNPYKFQKQIPAIPKILELLAKKEPELPEERFSPQFQHFIKCCLSKDPTKRWSSTQLLTHPWILGFGHKDNSSIANWIKEMKKEKLM